MTTLQAPLTGGALDRPFIYPPSALLLFTPWSLLPFKASWLLSAGAAGALAAIVGGRMGANPFLLIAAPPVFLCLIAGQPALFVAALVAGGCIALQRKPALAGLAWGVAAAIKPTLLLLAPLALIAGAHWRSLFAAAGTGVAMAAASVLWLGMQPWWDWLQALPRFNALFAAFEPLVLNAVTPYAAALRLSIEGWWIPLLAATIAIPAVIFSFRWSTDPALRLIALVGGALLIAPYSMNYELAALAPAVLSRRLTAPADLVLPLVWAGSLFFSASVIGLVAVYGWMLASVFDQARMQRRIDIAAGQDDCGSAVAGNHTGQHRRQGD